MQRGGSPCPYDRVFASRLGAEAGKLILEDEEIEDPTNQISLKDAQKINPTYQMGDIAEVDVAGKLKMLDPDAAIIKEAKMLGISFGD